MCAEALNPMLQKVERTREITGVLIARGRVQLNHLFFADDSLIFCKATIMEWSILQNVLDRYDQVLGQGLYREKTFIFFNQKTKVVVKRQILRVSRIQATYCFEKYLGLPALGGRSQRIWVYVCQRSNMEQD